MTAEVKHHVEPGFEYDGPAVLVAGEEQVDVVAVLRAGFQPLDGRWHWWGRVSAPDGAPPLAESVGSGAEAGLRTPYGEAAGRLTDPDPWGRWRIDGLGRPPF